MGAAELVRTIEQAGGHFTVDTCDPEMVYVHGEALEDLLPLLECYKVQVADYLLLRRFLEVWDPPQGERVQ